MNSITLKQLNEFAKNAGVSENVEIYALGAIVSFMAACRENDTNVEFITLDEEYLDCDDVTNGDEDTVILRLWDDQEGERQSYPTCQRCKCFHRAGTRDPYTGYCKFYEEEVDENEECDNFEWRD